MWLYQIFHAFIHYHLVASRSWAECNDRGKRLISRATQKGYYALYRQWPGLYDDPWRLPWQAGEEVYMNALCDRLDEKRDEYCIRCGRYNSLNDCRNWEGEGRIEW